MSISSKIIKSIKNPRLVLDYIVRQQWSHKMSDKAYIALRYWCIFGKKINLNEPTSFNEKLNWMKLYNRNPQYTMMADKYSVKQFVAERIGGRYVVDNYIVAEKWEDIDFSTLPNQFVIKGTHDSGGAIVCRDKQSFDFKAAKEKINRNLKGNWFWFYREWPYKNIKPQIIVDRLLDDHTGKELRDYKWWCFNGKPTFMYLTIKGDNVYENFYDMDFQPVAVDHGFPRHQPEFEKPSQFELMKELAAKLSADIPFVRVDFFQVEEQVFFGEFTFYDWGGMRPFNGEWDNKLGQLLTLPIINK